MPNHVEHDMSVRGPAEDLRAFETFAQEGERLLSANKFIPYPEAYARPDAEREAWWKLDKTNRGPMPPDGFNAGGYEWCVDNWGTKWGIYQSQKITHANRMGTVVGDLGYSFQSAWSPALKVIEAMSRRFPSLRFKVRYYEMGCQFQGHFVVKNGVIQTNERLEYNGERGG